MLRHPARSATIVRQCTNTIVTDPYSADFLHWARAGTPLVRILGIVFGQRIGKNCKKKILARKPRRNIDLLRDPRGSPRGGVGPLDKLGGWSRLPILVGFWACAMSKIRSLSPHHCLGGGSPLDQGGEPPQISSLHHGIAPLG